MRAQKHLEHELGLSTVESTFIWSGVSKAIYLALREGEKVGFQGVLEISLSRCAGMGGHKVLKIRPLPKARKVLVQAAIELNGGKIKPD